MVELNFKIPLREGKDYHSRFGSFVLGLLASSSITFLNASLEGYSFTIQLDRSHTLPRVRANVAELARANKLKMQIAD